MKGSGKCIKCQSKAVVRIPGYTGGMGSNRIVMTGWVTAEQIPVTRFVCTSCGYSEEWIELLEHLETLAKKFGPSYR